MSERWSGTGPDYRLSWGGRTWRVSLGDDRPGLVSEDEAGPPLLGLVAIAADGRPPRGLGRDVLVGHEVRFDRLEATYALPDWGDLRLRLAWSPRSDDRVELEVQVQAGSVGELSGVEVIVGGTGPGGDRFLVLAHPDDVARDAATETGSFPLFGHDLEKGVVIRARVQAHRLLGWAESHDRAVRLERFKAEPPPLGP